MDGSRLTISILAHVDAGKTTLAESFLYLGGVIRKPGRVDNRDSFLDNHDIERERGITVFSKQAELVFGGRKVTLLDTPGHVDFSAEMERTLQVTDYAILVISGSDGVQSHVVTLWRLLKLYKIPVFIFVNKMDQPDNNPDTIMDELKNRLAPECVDFTHCKDESEGDFYEEAAMCSEEALDEYIGTQAVSAGTITEMIRNRQIFPCFFGSALKITGVSEFMEGIGTYTRTPVYGGEFAAKVYKITRDNQGNRLTHVKLTGGSLTPKMIIDGEKVNQIRIYSGEGYESVNEASAGEICAVTGLDNTFCGQGLGCEPDSDAPMLEPVMVYRLILPDTCNVHDMYNRLRQLEEEEPALQIEWNEQSGEINVKLMGEIQTGVLERIIRERFDTKVSFDAGSIVYKETIACMTEGVGHYEPLKHYAEVHLIIEPAERGSGVTIETDCSEDELAGNWQRLIVSNLSDKVHRGILTGGELTDVRITVAGGRAHLKHTEGGDFRQASYRAVRHALMKAGCVLLEPMYSYRLEIPADMIGRAMTDIQKMHGTFGEPSADGEITYIEGVCPVATMRGYQTELAAYSKGMGRLFCSLCGYGECHNPEEVVSCSGYDAEADIANPAGSVFCSHGAGVYVPWEQVEDYMHVEKKYIGRDIKPEIPAAAYHSEPESYQAVSLHGFSDKELEDIFVKTYGEIKHKRDTAIKRTVDYDRPPEPRSHEAKRNSSAKKTKEDYLLVDGYNIIFAWDELKDLAADNFDSARTRLLDIMCNYQGYKKMTVIVVFDAYRVKGKSREVMEYNNIHVVYTKEAETADQYIEKTVHKLGGNHNVTVATSDALEQIIIFGQGAVRLSAAGLLAEVRAAEEEIRDIQYNNSLKS